MRLSPEEAALLLPGAHLDLMLDVERRVLRRGDGTDVDLGSQPKLFEALELLVRGQGRAFSRAAFFGRLWGNEKQVYDIEAHEQKVIKTLQRLRPLVGEDLHGRNPLVFARESDIGLRPGTRAGVLEPAQMQRNPLGIRQARIVAELAIEPRSAAELALLLGADQGAVAAELAGLLRLQRVVRQGHGRGVRYFLMERGRLSRTA